MSTDPTLGGMSGNAVIEFLTTLQYAALYSMLSTLKKMGLLIGLSMLLMTIFLPAPTGMSIPAWHTTGAALLLAIWWATEVLPIPVTSLLPVLLFPALGVMTMEQSTLPYAEPTIFLLLG